MSGYRRYVVVFMALYFAAHLISVLGRDARAMTPATSDEAMPQLAFNPSDTIALPPPRATIRNRRWALVQIPLQVVNLPVGYKLTALSVKPEIEFADGSTWNSDWRSLLAFGQQLGLGTPLPEGDTVAAFLMERTLFDAKAAIPATVHLTLALVLTQETGQSTLQPADEFLLPGAGLCRFRQPGHNNLGLPAWCLMPETVPLGHAPQRDARELRRAVARMVSLAWDGHEVHANFELFGNEREGFGESRLLSAGKRVSLFCRRRSTAVDLHGPANYGSRL